MRQTEEEVKITRQQLINAAITQTISRMLLLTGPHYEKNVFQNREQGEENDDRSRSNENGPGRID